MNIERFARLTDRQIFELYLHARESDGSVAEPPEEVKAPEEPPTLERELQGLSMLASVLGLTPEKVAELKSQIEAKFAHEQPIERSAP